MGRRGRLGIAMTMPAGGGGGGGRAWGVKCAYPLDRVIEQGGETAAVADDFDHRFPPQRMGRHDAEVAADVGDDGTDRPTAHLGGDLLRRERVRETRGGRIGVRRGRSGGARLARGRRAAGPGFGVETGGVADQPCFERVSAVQPLRDARQDQRDGAGAEAADADGGDRGGATLPQRVGEFLAVIDEPAHEGDEAPGAAVLVRAGRIGAGRLLGSRAVRAADMNMTRTQFGLRCQGMFSG